MFWWWCDAAVNEPCVAVNLQAARLLIQDIVASIRHIRCEGGDPPSVGPKCNCIRATGCSSPQEAVRWRSRQVYTAVPQAAANEARLSGERVLSAIRKGRASRLRSRLEGRSGSVTRRCPAVLWSPYPGGRRPPSPLLRGAGSCNQSLVGDAVRACTHLQRRVLGRLPAGHGWRNLWFRGQARAQTCSQAQKVIQCSTFPVTSR